MAASGFLTVQGSVRALEPWAALGMGEEKKGQSSEAAAAAFEEQAVHLCPSLAFVKRRLCDM